MQLPPALQLLRPIQYLKNFFVFLPIFFGLKMTDLSALGMTTLAFIAFCATASAVYILNDALDLEEDRLHPIKQTRPLAAKSVSPHTALILFSFLVLLGFSLGYYLSILPLLGLYLLLNFCYSIYLKKIAILDVTLIAIGFVIRLFVGAVVTGIALSMWIVLLTFLIALFLALSKRRDDVLAFLKNGVHLRQSTQGYSLEFLSVSMAMMGTIVIVCYIMYTSSPEVMARLHSHYLYLTSGFVILGIMRYLQIVFVEQKSASPTTILASDRFLQICIALWFSSFGYLIYVKGV